jgi:Flp pilus assembly protein TadD
LTQQAASAGDALSRQGDFRGALERYLHAVALRPGDTRLHYSVACAAREVDELQLVEKHLLEAIRLEPKCTPAHSALGLHYSQVGQTDLALLHSETAMALDGKFPAYVIGRAFVLAATGRAREAWDLVEPLAVSGSTAPQLVYIYTKLASSLGHEARAAELANRALGAADVPAADRPHLRLAASSMLDKMGQWDAAFEQARLGKDSLRAFRQPFDSAAHSKMVSRKIEYFSKGRMQSLPRATHGSGRPVFIVGMPRSGTSLIEQILASHPAIFGAGELRALPRIAHDLPKADWAGGEAYPECLDSLSQRGANRLASQYLSDIESINKDATHVTDKMTENYLNLDLVELLMPGCRVIHCVRAALDTCVSCYLTDFARGNEFTMDLDHLGAYYRDYRRLMEHWKKVLSLPMLDVRYEDVVLDTEYQARRMLEFLGLPWDERCLKYHENKRRVNTASEDQVRRPIYTSSIGRWKHYEKHLSSLIRSLAG